MSVKKDKERDQHLNIILPHGSSGKLVKSLDYWSKHNPLLMAEEIFFESRNVVMGKLNFIFKCIGYSLGLGNTWRFPYVCLKYGGGSFLVAYLIITLFVGLPLLLIELWLSQFTSKGAAQCWNFIPGFKGIGLSMILINLSCCLCYTLVLGWILFYVICSLRFTLPFLNCDNKWNDALCVPSGTKDINISGNEFSSEQFWLRFVTNYVSYDGKYLGHIDDNPEELIWYSTACMIISWTISAFVLAKEVKIVKRLFYLFIFLTYLSMIGIIVVSLNIPGSFNGLYLYFVPDYKTLLNIKTWTSATEQMFFSLGIGFGGMLTIGKHNDFHRSIQKYIFFICLVNFITAILCGLTVYLIIGNILQHYSLETVNFEAIAEKGIIFVIFPEWFGRFNYPQITCCGFYVLIFSLGLGGMVVMLETVISGFMNVFPIIDETHYHRICFTLLLHVACGCFSLIFVTRVGYFWFKIFEKYCLSFNLLIVGFLEATAVSYIYKLKNVSRDYKMMVSRKLPILWTIPLYTAAPILLIMSILKLVKWKRTTSKYGSHIAIYPLWADLIGWALLICTLLSIPGFFISFIRFKIKIINITFKEAFRQTIIPNLKWGPMKKRKWLLDSYYNERLTKLKEESENYKLKITSFNDEDEDKNNIYAPKWFLSSKAAISDDDYSERLSRKMYDTVFKVMEARSESDFNETP